jgi:preprotein translocase subunit SecG
VLWLVSTIHVMVCLFLILVVLLQQGKGADLSVFGGGGTQAAFGARGATTLLHKLTVGAFVAFIVTTMGIGLLKNTARATSVLSDVPATATEDAATPAADETPATTDAAATATDEAAAPAGAGDAAASDATLPAAGDEGATTPEPMDESGGGQ